MDTNFDNDYDNYQLKKSAEIGQPPNAPLLTSKSGPIFPQSNELIFDNYISNLAELNSPMWNQHKK